VSRRFRRCLGEITAINNSSTRNQQRGAVQSRTTFVWLKIPKTASDKTDLWQRSFIDDCWMWSSGESRQSVREIESGSNWKLWKRATVSNVEIGICMMVDLHRFRREMHWRLLEYRRKHEEVFKSTPITPDVIKTSFIANETWDQREAQRDTISRKSRTRLPNNLLLIDSSSLTSTQSSFNTKFIAVWGSQAHLSLSDSSQLQRFKWDSSKNLLENSFRRRQLWKCLSFFLLLAFSFV
jgi:hypothetical protein